MKKLRQAFVVLLLIIALLTAACTIKIETDDNKNNNTSSSNQKKESTPKEQPEKIPEGSDSQNNYEQPVQPEPESQDTGNYIGNRNSGKLHNLAHPSCQNYVNMMNEENKVEFDSEQDGIDEGYNPCKKC